MTDNKATAKAVLLELANMILAMYEEDTSKIVGKPAVDPEPWADAPATKKPRAKKVTIKEAVEMLPDDDDDDVADADAEATDDGTDWDARTAEVKAWSLAKIKKRLVDDMAFDPEDLKGVSKDDLVADMIETEKFFAAGGEDPEDDDIEDEDDADDIEDADDEDDADDEEELTREEAMQYTLVELKGIAKDSGFAAADLKGLDKDGIIDLIFEDDDADDDTDEEVLTQDDLEGMSLAELKALCRDNGITVKRGSTQESLIEALVDADVVAA